VNKFLKAVNGLSGKIDRLLIPLTAGDKLIAIKNLKPLSGRISEMRNRIVHEGEFCNEGEAEETIEKAREFIETLVQLYKPRFELKDQK
jgi:hypothetical protein